MGPLTKVLVLVALVVPATAYVAGSLVSSDGPDPVDRDPVILRDATPTPSPEGQSSSRRPSGPERDDPPPAGGGDHQGEARVVTPLPTPVGEDDDDEWDDDGPDDEDTDDSDDERGDD